MTTGADPRELAWQRFPNDALEIPDQVRTRPCRSSRCALPVWDGLTAKNRKPNAFDVKANGELTGTSHWRTCLDRDRFRR